MTSKPNLLVAPCSYQAAKHAVMRWHYSRAMPTPPIVRFWVWESNVFIGSVLFSRGANKNLGKAYGLRAVDCCELTRVAIAPHSSPVSRIVSLAMRQLKTQKIRLVYSYADPNEGHHGGIYQAMNWIYTGRTPKSYKYRDVNGRVWHQRQVSVSGVKRQYGELRTVPKIGDCEKIEQKGKHRYLYPLDRAMRRQIAPLAQPYPKKSDSDARPVNGDTIATSDAGRFDPDPDA